MHKKTMKIAPISIIFVLVISTSMSFARRNGQGRRNQQFCNYVPILAQYPKAKLTQKQKDGLKFMYEEEKMARDFYSTWNLRVFLNISSSEQQHMNAIKAILNKYDIKIKERKNGEFNNAGIQKLYNQLKKQGETSYINALKVSKKVEEVDIEDLDKQLKKVPEDTKNIYESLKHGSQNHLNAFIRNGA